MLENLYKYIIYYLIVLCIFSFLGMKFAKKHKEAQEGKQLRLKKLYKNCPCRKSADSGILSVICIYSAAGAFMLAFINIGFVFNYSKDILLMIVLSIFCFFFGWILKK